MSLVLPEIKSKFLPKSTIAQSAVFHNGKMIIHGGIGHINQEEQQMIDAFGYRYTYDENYLWCYDLEFSKWFCIKTHGNDPHHPDLEDLFFSNVCVFRDSMIVFGGTRCHEMTSDVYNLDLNSYKWQNLTAEGLIEGPAPSERQEFGFWMHMHQIIYFGGYGAPLKEHEANGEFCPFEEPYLTGYNNGVCILDFSENDRIMWKYPEVKGQKPLPRAAHACTEIGNRGFVFGGRTNQRLNDMFWLDLDTFEWHMIEYKSNAPCGRSWHSLNRLSNDRILLYGGIDTDGNVLSDMWIFNITESTWNEIQYVHSRLREFAPRMMHTAINTDEEGEVIIFGGGTIFGLGEHQYCNLLTVFRANPQRLRQLCIERVVEYWQILSGRFGSLPHSVLTIIERHL